MKRRLVENLKFKINKEHRSEATSMVFCCECHFNRLYVIVNRLSVFRLNTSAI